MEPEDVALTEPLRRETLDYLERRFEWVRGREPQVDSQHVRLRCLEVSAVVDRDTTFERNITRDEESTSDTASRILGRAATFVAWVTEATS